MALTVDSLFLKKVQRAMLPSVPNYFAEVCLLYRAPPIFRYGPAGKIVTQEAGVSLLFLVVVVETSPLVRLSFPRHQEELADTMSVQNFMDFHRNGKQNGIGKVVRTKTSSKFWRYFQINEWTFSLFLFVLSLGIVTGKLFVNYGNTDKWSVNVGISAKSLTSFSRMYDVFGVPNNQKLSNFDGEHLKIAGEKLMNVSRDYGDAMAEAIFGITHKYAWLLRAALCGIAMMGFTWFIIYKDSSIPGVNPPSPFSPTKRRYPEKSRLQINYLVGALNGILIFVYMCL